MQLLLKPTKTIIWLLGNCKGFDGSVYKEVLCAMMLPSSNEIARIVAREVGSKI